ncbi:MAG: spondin domain-containing protein [Bdellovibrionales bacterium]
MRGKIIVQLVFTLFMAPFAWANVEYRLSLTNLTRNQALSAPLIALHAPEFRMFTLGHPPSPGLAMLAEEGARDLLKSEMSSATEDGFVYEGTVSIAPGKTRIYKFKVPSKDLVLSFATMLVTTNDGFTGVSNLPLPAAELYTDLYSYDAGSERNTESCDHIPGPPCGSHNVRVIDGAEGRVQIHPGIVGSGDLAPSQAGWSEPVVRIHLEKL